MDFQFGQVPAAAYGFIGLTAAVMAYATLADSDTTNTSSSSSRSEQQKGGGGKTRRRRQAKQIANDVVKAITIITPLHKQKKQKQKRRNQTM